MSLGIKRITIKQILTSGNGQIMRKMQILEIGITSQKLKKPKILEIGITSQKRKKPNQILGLDGEEPSYKIQIQILGILTILTVIISLGMRICINLRVAVG